MTKTRFLIYSAAVVLLALFVREWFVLTAIPVNPTQGDVSSYLRYALHMAWDGVYSSAEGGQPVTPDAYRSPGYPWFLFATFKLAPDAWYATTYQAQVLLGAATVACVIALARQWLAPGWALVAGLWMSLQPHHIAATGAMLTEVLFGFTIAAGLLCAVVACRRRSMRLALLAGAVLGFGALVNPILTLLPFLLVPLFWRDGLLKHGVALALVSLVFVGSWSIRNAAVGAKGDDRAVINFVQGSWLEYHDAWRYQKKLMRYRLDVINAEVDAAVADRSALKQVGERIASDPAHYAGWYLSKPYLLWDWDVRIGQGGVYTLEVKNSPLDRGVMRAVSALQIGLNLPLFVLAFVGIVIALWQGGPARFVALAVLYVTAVHVVLQAEPRYAIPYRSMEILLAVSAMAYLRSIYRPSRRATITASTERPAVVMAE